jgi:uncharacterized membrane protein YoaT (DUF817 family)
MHKILYSSTARIALVVLQITAVSIWYSEPIAVFVATAVIAVTFLATLHFSRRYVFSFFLFGVLGTVAEFFPVQFGAWSYAEVGRVGLPAYLPIIWGTAGVAIIHTAEKMGFYGRTT